MEAKTSKTLDGSAHLSGVSTPTNMVVKQMRLVEGVSESNDSGPEDIVDLVKKDFKIKKTCVEVELDGQKVLLDFLHMHNVDFKTGFKQPIAWIDEEENCFFPEEMFLIGMTILGITESDIVDIYCNSSMLMQTRLELFQKQADLTNGIQGEANVRYAWIACSKDELSLYCDVDEDGIKYLVLCRVKMGKMELLRPSNDQRCSSGYEYENEVDDIQSP
ncbi:inactive poly [ADP-ribose] polymerase RCD1, putative [Medicago truncatula]|uniref:Inactive poly [ADP-ribose] polymerase RCD1, putative n=1 Tax=Medicago truncatula TaxID=3880 RepID=A0A072VAM3_MEDTR|nr:inactive poly [ADP-ribose] polymerase RCD1, putative [Medicago truncatula]